MEERGDDAEHFSPENRINDFINFVSERIGNRILTEAEEQMIRDYANQYINVVFGDDNNHNPTQTGGAKKRRNRKIRKTRKTKKTKKTRKSRKTSRYKKSRKH
jgi:hypothetical protein